MATEIIAEAHTADDHVFEAICRLSSAESILFCLGCAVESDSTPSAEEVKNAMWGVRAIIADATKMFEDAHYSQQRAQA